MHFKTAHLKLTLFYVLIAMSISIIFSIAIFQISSNELGRGLGRQAGALRDINIQGFSDRASILEQLRTDQINESNNNLRNNLIYYNLLILILSSVAGYFLARKTLKPIEETMDAQNRFTADASHELRTPLTALRTEIEVNLKDKNLNLSEAKKLLNSNLEEVSKLESLASALLKLAKFDDDKTVIFKTVALEDIIIDSYEKVACLAEKKSIEFKNEFKNISIKGDYQSLVELFVILLDNAIKYSPSNSRIWINMSEEKKDIIVKIKDNGLGIKSSDLPFVFNRFYRADTSRSKEKIDGYGLGLSIAKSIVELHRGQISVDSKPGKGSEFIIHFPMN
jgi:two-component system, OmpR family, sensor histidine kinase CiaH